MLVFRKKNMRKIGIIGCGWLGLHLADYLKSNSEIFTTTTSEYKNKELIQRRFHSEVVRFSDDEISNDHQKWEILNVLDAIILTVPFSKKTDFEALQNRFQNISQFIKGFEKPLFLMSSIGIYPQINQEISESSLPENLLDTNIFGVEKLMKQNFPQINILRLGGLMGEDRYLSKYKISNPNQVVNHVHYSDVCLVIEKMMSLNLTSKTYNIVSPKHPMKQEIIDFQQQLQHTENLIPEGRVIISKLSEQELSFEYQCPNPILFV